MQHKTARKDEKGGSIETFPLTTMKIRPRYTRKDLNHAEVRDGCRAVGMVVMDTADLVGTLDLICCWRGRCVPVEVKQPGMENQLTPNEQKAFAALRAVGVEPVVATCAEDVVEAFGADHERLPSRGGT